MPMANMNDEMLALLVNGGDIPSKDSPPMEEDFVDESLLRQIGALVAEGASVDKVAKVLDAPAEKISATLRRERKRIAIILMAGVAKNLAVYAGRYYGILDIVLKEIERRLSDPETLEKTSTSVLIKLLKIAHDWIGPMNDKLVLSAPDDAIRDGAGNLAAGVNLNSNTFNFLVSEAEKVKDVEVKAKRSVDSRRKKKKSTEPPVYDYDIEVEDPSDLD